MLLKDYIFFLIKYSVNFLNQIIIFPLLNSEPLPSQFFTINQSCQCMVCVFSVVVCLLLINLSKLNSFIVNISKYSDAFVKSIVSGLDDKFLNICCTVEMFNNILLIPLLLIFLTALDLVIIKSLRN